MHAVELTDRQTAILEFIEENISTRKCPPSVREIMDEFDIKSPNGVQCHLNALQSKGVIRRELGKARNIRLTYEPEQLCCPHCGRSL